MPHAAPSALPAIAERVRDQYIRYPYPPPDWDTARTPVFGLLDYIRYVLWPGRPDLRGLRVLDAGCGTGDAALFIARRHPEVEVVGIDLSPTSLGIVRERAAQAGVQNLALHQLPIEEVAPEALGGCFDYIISSGVLHHLADPDAGLRALAGLLAPQGGLALMLYATHGRRSVYLMQELLDRLAGDLDLVERVELTRRLLDNLPGSNPFQPAAWFDLAKLGDSGLVDLLLHARDRSYTVPEIYACLAGADLRLERFFAPRTYRPRTYLEDADLLRRAESRPECEQAAIAELLHGGIHRHSVIATHAEHTPPRFERRGLMLLALRPLRSPLFRWERAEVKRRKKAQYVCVTEHAYDFAPLRTLELSDWQVRTIEACDGTRSGMEAFRTPAVFNAIPGTTPDERFQAFGDFLQRMADEEALLFEP